MIGETHYSYLITQVEKVMIEVAKELGIKSLMVELNENSVKDIFNNFNFMRRQI